jgi:hypothetical protein
VSPVASPDAGSGVQVEVVPTPEPGASIAAGTTEIAGTSAPGMTPPPVEPPITPPHANRGSAPSTNPQTAPVNTNPTTAPVQTAQNQDFSILDTPQEDTADGTEAGQRLAEQYGRGRTPSGPRARFQKRARFPHPLGQTEKPAVATLLYVINAQEAYHRKHGRYGTLNELMTARSLFLDVSVRTSSFERRGYRFEVTNQSDGFEITATPMSAGPRPFIGDDSGFVRVGTD